jgi:SAM-dependent methyltransferase
MVAPLLGHLARRLADALDWIGRRVSRLADLLRGLLPALLPPAELSRLVREYYLPGYVGKELDPAGLVALPPEEDLDVWEWNVLERHGVRSGRILVMGAGTGRESIGMARRGLSVVGLDSSLDAIRTARLLAAFQGVPVKLHQGDYLALPYAARSFNYAVLSAIMYSAIPGKAHRRAWLRDLARVLVPGGLAILSFQPRIGAPGRLERLCARLNRVLLRLPGANRAYQPGDDCTSIHFLHRFEDEAEIRAEVTDAGLTVRELAWSRGYAVAAVPDQSARG